MAIFLHFSHTSSHLYPLQVENCDSNSRLVVDKDDNGKFRPERVNHKWPITDLVEIWVSCLRRLCCLLVCSEWKAWTRSCVNKSNTSILIIVQSYYHSQPEGLHNMRYPLSVVLTLCLLSTKIVVFNPYSAGIDCRRQILTYKVDPHSILVMVVYP